MNAYLTADVLRLIIPEIILVAMAAYIYVAGAFGTGRGAWTLLALVGLGIVGYAFYLQDASNKIGIFQEIAVPIHFGPLIIDSFGHAMRWGVGVVGLLFVLLSARAASDHLATEYLGSLLLVIAGTMLVCTAGELVLIFVGLELISIPTYILLYLGRANASSQEATAKYFFLSVFSSAILLYGFSFLYGITGATQLGEIQQTLAAADPQAGGLMALLPLALVLILAGLAFKMAAVPFHFYAPDVYQGTTSGNAALLAVVPKIAGVVLLVRLVAVAMPGVEHLGWKLVLAISIVTMTVGNVMALWQQNIRRLLAYSSIAHAGYMLVGLAVALAAADGAEVSGKFNGLGAMVFYLVTYVVATLAAFSALAWLARRDRDLDGVDELAGLGRTHPLAAVVIALAMFSLMGIPPLPGFWGKLTLFFAALDVDSGGGPLRPWFIGLAVAGALNAAIAAGYYLRVVASMYFRGPVNVPRTEGGWGAQLAMLGAMAMLIVAGLFPGSLIGMANRACRAAQATPATLQALESADAGSPGGQAATVASGQTEELAIDR